MQMRKVLAPVLDVLGLACLGGVYALDYFTKTRLGMTRWVNFNGHALREAFPIDAVCTALAAAALVGVVLALVLRTAKTGRPRPLAVAVALVSLACALAALLVCVGAVHTLAKPFTLVAAAGAAVFALPAAVVAPWGHHSEAKA